MFLKSSRDRNVDIATSTPYGRVSRLNYVRDGEDYLFIITAEWVHEILSVPQIYIGKSTYIMHQLADGQNLPRFLEKYGKVHCMKHFSDKCKHFRATPGLLDYDPCLYVRRAFDSLSEGYQETISSNQVQAYMRQVSKEVLRQYCFEGAQILELGGGTMPETQSFLSHSKITEVEISTRMISTVLPKLSEAERKNLVHFTSIGDSRIEDNHFDIVFSTYGYLELNDLGESMELAYRKLADNGVFIAGIWNRHGFMDLLAALLEGKGAYIMAKLRGTVPPNLSRYELESRPGTARSFTENKKFRLEGKRGVGIILPPYNTKLAAKMASSSLLRKIDTALCRVPWISEFADYIVLVLRKSSTANRNS